MTWSRVTRFSTAVTGGTDLTTLTHAENAPLILSLRPLPGPLQAALARSNALEARLAKYERSQKNPDNSSPPPPKG